MAPKSFGLGKGLDALLPVDDGPADQTGAGVPGGGEILVPLEKLAPNPDQPRKTFNPDELQELADSIREHGIIQPIITEKAEDGTYTIVAGERRYRAAKMAGLSDVPILVRSFSDEKRLEISLIENVQRSDLNPIEEALAYKKLMDLTGLSQDQAAAKVGKNRSTVANALRLLKLPAAIRKSLETGELTPGHGRAILSVGPMEDQETLFQEILERGLSVREAEKRAAALGQGAKQSSPAPALGRKMDPELQAIEQKFIETLGTKVVIHGDLEKGHIEIDYYSMEDLDRLYGIVGGK